MACVDQVVVRRIRLGEHSKLLFVLLPWKPAAVDDDSTHRRAVTAHELRQRVDNDVGTEFERAKEDRRSNGVIDDQWNAALVRCRRQRLDITDVPGGVSNALAEDCTRLVIDQAGDGRRVVALGKAH